MRSAADAHDARTRQMSLDLESHAEALRALDEEGQKARQEARGEADTLAAAVRGCQTSVTEAEDRVGAELSSLRSEIAGLHSSAKAASEREAHTLEAVLNLRTSQNQVGTLSISCAACVLSRPLHLWTSACTPSLFSSYVRVMCCVSSTHDCYVSNQSAPCCSQVSAWMEHVQRETASTKLGPNNSSELLHEVRNALLDYELSNYAQLTSSSAFVLILRDPHPVAMLLSAMHAFYHTYC